MTRREIIADLISRGDTDELLRLCILQQAEGPRCACRGAVDDEPQCWCLMTSRQIRNAVSLASLRRGKWLRLKEIAP